MKDTLGDRVKAYESQFETHLDTSMPVIARIDGRAFHMFTRIMDRPFDERLTDAMVATTKALVIETSALVGFTQSDEITLVWHCRPNQQLWFGGRVQKMASNLAAFATSRFFKQVLDTMPEHAYRLPTFDARVWGVPGCYDVVDALVWRQLDTFKNSISQLAGAHFTHKQLQGVNSSNKLSMLTEKGIDWHKINHKFTLGTFVRSKRVKRKFTAIELSELPPKHFAHQNPDLEVERTEIDIMYISSLLEYSNSLDIIYKGAEPKIKE